MLLESIGSNAEFVGQFSVTDKIKRIAIPNKLRDSGLIINKSTSEIAIEFSDFPYRLIQHPSKALIVPANGGNLDIPRNYVGAIWVRWRKPTARGYLNIHHYYHTKK
jgi:hypothetical protein